MYIDGDNPDNEFNTETGDGADGNDENDENQQVNDGKLYKTFLQVYLICLDIPGEEQFDEDG